MKRRILSMLPTLLVLALLAGLVAVRSVTTAQSFYSTAIAPEYAAQYSTDGETWQPLSGPDAVSKIGSRILYLRVTFPLGCPEGLGLNFYLNHLFFSMEVGGQVVASYLPDEAGCFPAGDLCGTQWYDLPSPGISGEEVVTFTLVNPHRSGNGTAYRDFLKNMWFGSQSAVKSQLASHWQGWRALGIVLIAGGVVLLGMALAAALSHLPMDKWLGQLSVVSLCAGIWLLFDTPDVQLWSNKVVQNTTLVLVSRMGTAFGLSLCIRSLLNDAPWRRAAGAASAVLGGGTSILAVLALLGTLTPCRTEPWWNLLWLLCGGVLLACLLLSLRQRPSLDAGAFALVLLAWLADYLNTVLLWWPNGITAKLCLVLVLLVEALQGVQKILQNYEAAQHTLQMERELQNSRISIMLSQIKPHFLYNALTVIQALCGIDPAAAENAVSEFSDYLRGNMNALTEDKPVPFSKELEHTKHYLTLEQLRFGDQLRVEFDLGPTLFRLPTLSLQPLVENAIRHGVRGKAEGVGTVRISTRETPTSYEVIVTDDGPGFDLASVIQDSTHVGITNVRRRMQLMCGGSLLIDSTPGAGTQATLRVPKKTNIIDDMKTGNELC